MRSLLTIPRCVAGASAVLLMLFTARVVADARSHSESAPDGTAVSVSGRPGYVGALHVGRRVTYYLTAQFDSGPGPIAFKLQLHGGWTLDAINSVEKGCGGDYPEPTLLT